MNIAAIVAGVTAIAKAIPAIRDIVSMAQAQLVRWELSQITNKYTERQKLIDALVNSISKATTREERRALSKILHRYTSGKY